MKGQAALARQDTLHLAIMPCSHRPLRTSEGDDDDDDDDDDGDDDDDDDGDGDDEDNDEDSMRLFSPRC